MLYLIAIFCSPLALLFAFRPFQAIFNLVLYIVSIVCWATLIFAHVGFVLWAVAFLHAALVISDAHEDRRVRRLMSTLRR